jgi:hypothetical protein
MKYRERIKFAKQQGERCNSKLVEVDLRNSNITSFQEVLQMTWDNFYADVSTLDLSGNRITSFEGLEHFRQLKILKLNDNNYTAIPEGLKRLNSACDIQLHLSDNNISSLDGLQMKGISHLYLENNLFTDFSDAELSKINNPVFKNLANPYHYHIYLKGNPFYNTNWVNKINLPSIIGQFNVASQLPYWYIHIYTDDVSLKVNYKTKTWYKGISHYIEKEAMHFALPQNTLATFKRSIASFLNGCIADLYCSLTSEGNADDRNTGKKLYRYLAKNKDIPIQRMHKQLDWYGFTFESLGAKSHLYVKPYDDTKKRYPIFIGQFVTDNSIITGSGEFIEGRERVIKYESLLCSNFWSKAIYEKAKKRYLKNRAKMKGSKSGVDFPGFAK